MSPSLLKLLTGIVVDARLVKKRRTYFIWTSLIQVLCFFLITFVPLGLGLMVALLWITQMAIVLQDTALESIMIQQARCDPESGQQELQTSRLLLFGMGAVLGGVASSITEQYFNVYHTFFLCLCVVAGMTVASFQVDEVVETNKWATMVDHNEVKYIRDTLAAYPTPVEYSAESHFEISFWQLVKIRWTTMKQGLNESIVNKFYLFLMIQGTMPDFGDFIYFFAIDVMKITLFQIGLSTVVVGVLVIGCPILYQVYLQKTDYQKLFIGA